MQLTRQALNGAQPTAPTAEGAATLWPIATESTYGCQFPSIPPDVLSYPHLPFALHFLYHHGLVKGMSVGLSAAWATNFV
jgi:hypothetical protein